MKIKIDESKCIGAGHCVSVAPETFAQREEDGLVVLLDDNPAKDKLGLAVEAARLCPARAIVVDTDGH